MATSTTSIMVCGGAGFIGSHLVDQLLESGAEKVRVYDNLSRGTLANLKSASLDSRFEFFEEGGDILHKDMLEKSMEGMDGVFHLAALWLLQCYEYPRSAFDVNVAGTMNVIEAIIATGVKRLVFSSSASVYGEAISEPMEEDHPFLCQEFYGASKVCGEMMLQALFNRQQKFESRFDYVGLRYMNVYWSRQYDKGSYVGVVTRMLAALDAKESPSIYGDGSQSYDFIDVRDCARANLLAMQSNSTDSFYNVGTGMKTSISRLAELLASSHSNKLDPIYKSVERSFMKNRIGCIEKARKELGFVAEMPLEQGVRELIQWRNGQAKTRNIL